MTILQSILLGFIQGITEFLPISSSGHLVLLPFFLKWEIPEQDAFIFDVLVQVATLLAVIVYFRKELLDIIVSLLHSVLQRTLWRDPRSRLGWMLLLATIPAGLIGLLLKEQVETAFASPASVGVFLLFTAALLTLAEKIGQKSKGIYQLRWLDALWIGFAQALAIFPGVSRSGATIAGAMSRDMERKDAAGFSFILSIPIMLAAGVLSILDLKQLPHAMELIPTYIPGFIVSAVVGYIAIHWLLRFLRQKPLYVFAIYCAVLGTVTIVINWFQ